MSCSFAAGEYPSYALRSAAGKIVHCNNLNVRYGGLSAIYSSQMRCRHCKAVHLLPHRFRIRARCHLLPAAGFFTVVESQGHANSSSGSSFASGTVSSKIADQSLPPSGTLVDFDLCRISRFSFRAAGTNLSSIARADTGRLAEDPSNRSVFASRKAGILDLEFSSDLDGLMTSSGCREHPSPSTTQTLFPSF